jgi:hypothetical protein
MRRSNLGTTVLVLGLLVGLAAVTGLALGLEPRLSPFMLKVVVYKLSFVAALALLVAGAAIRRGARRELPERPAAVGASRPAR